MTVIRYGMVGGFGAILHITILLVLTEWGGLPPLLGSCAGFVVTVWVTYPLHRHISFRGRTAPHQRARFYLVVCSGFLINASVMGFGTWMDASHYVIIQLAAMVLVPVSNFVFQSRWVFPKQKRP